MAVCPTGDVITLANYMNTFNGISCLPTGATIIKADGTVNTQALSSHVSTLINANAPAVVVGGIGAQDNPARNFAEKAAALRTNIKNEYCFYYPRYTFAITKILTDASTTGAKVDPALEANALILNTKLNTILLVMKSMVNSRFDTMGSYYNEGGVNRLNSDLDAARNQLASHSKTLQSNTLNSDAQAAMIDYTIEKNS